MPCPLNIIAHYFNEQKAFSATKCNLSACTCIGQEIILKHKIHVQVISEIYIQPQFMISYSIYTEIKFGFITVAETSKLHSLAYNVQLSCDINNDMSVAANCPLT